MTWTTTIVKFHGVAFFRCKMDEDDWHRVTQFVNDLQEQGEYEVFVPNSSDPEWYAIVISDNPPRMKRYDDPMIVDQATPDECTSCTPSLIISTSHHKHDSVEESRRNCAPQHLDEARDLVGDLYNLCYVGKWMVIDTM
jgi:hypothetical protein